MRPHINFKIIIITGKNQALRFTEVLHKALILLGISYSADGPTIHLFQRS
jgi:hypothetical protein